MGLRLELEPHHELLQESEQVDHLELGAVAGRQLRGGFGIGFGFGLGLGLGLGLGVGLGLG